MKAHFYKICQIIIVIILASTSNIANATHIMGGNITYEWVSGNDYEVKLVLFRDCAGISLGFNMGINVSSVTCGVSSTHTLPLDTAVILNTVCPSFSSSCSGGTGIGIEMAIYKGIVTMPSNCSDIEISFSTCCRNFLNNIQNSIWQSLGLSTSLNTANFLSNNSIQIAPEQAYILSTGKNYNIDLGGFEPDGDSIVFTLSTPLASPNVNVTGYSVPANLILLPNGVINWTPSATGTYALGIEISEYRNGTHISSAKIDIPIFVTAFSGNSIPQLHGIDSTGAYSVTVAAGSLVNFDIPSSDNDLFQNTSLYYYGEIDGASFTTDTSNHQKGSFIWQTDTLDVSPIPYVFYVTVADDNCMYIAKQSYMFKIWINNPDTINVWPGDANNDLIANNYDLLSLGLAYGATGPVRPNASLSWTAQPAPGWNTSFSSGVNHKYADTNGDGIVDANDTTAILLNYGLTHNKMGGATGGGTDPVLYIDLPDSVAAGDTLVAPILLGEVNNQVPSIHGLAFSVTYDPTLVEANTASVIFIPNWIGTAGTNSIDIEKDFHSQGFIDAAMTRIDGINSSGYGQIGTLYYVLPDDIAGKIADARSLYISTQNIQAVDASGQSVNLIGSTDSVIVFEKATGISPIDNNLNIQIFPIPASEKLNIRIHNLGSIEIALFNLMGERIYSVPESEVNEVVIPLSGLPDGVYILQVKTAQGNHAYRVVKH